MDDIIETDDCELPDEEHTKRLALALAPISPYDFTMGAIVSQRIDVSNCVIVIPSEWGEAN